MREKDWISSKQFYEKEKKSNYNISISSTISPLPIHNTQKLNNGIFSFFNIEEKVTNICITIGTLAHEKFIYII